MRRLRRLRIGVWLGVLAVALYAWLPIHFATDVVEAASQARAVLAGGDTESTPPRHSHHPAGHHGHHSTCPICAAASAAPAPAMLPAMAALPTPPAIIAPVGIADAHAALRAAPLTPYAPRGPPPAA